MPFRCPKKLCENLQIKPIYYSHEVIASSFKQCGRSEGTRIDTRLQVVSTLRIQKDPNSEIKARWDDDPDIEYSFPFPDISYYDLSFVKVQARMPGGQRVSDPIQSEVGVENPKAFSVIFPLTWKSYIYSEDDFKPRELIRELRDAPQLGVRFNPPPIRERLFTILTKWIYAARELGTWTEDFVAIATMLIEELRTHYWAAAGAPVDRVQQRLHQVEDPNDVFGKMMLEEQLKQTRISRRANPVCYNCRKPGHIRANCPLLTQIFQRGVASGAARSHQNGAQRKTDNPLGIVPHPKNYSCHWIEEIVEKFAKLVREVLSQISQNQCPECAQNYSYPNTDQNASLHTTDSTKGLTSNTCRAPHRFANSPED